MLTLLACFSRLSWVWSVLGCAKALTLGTAIVPFYSKMWLPVLSQTVGSMRTRLRLARQAPRRAPCWDGAAPAKSGGWTILEERDPCRLIGKNTLVHFPHNHLSWCFHGSIPSPLCDKVHSLALRNNLTSFISKSLENPDCTPLKKLKGLTPPHAVQWTDLHVTFSPLPPLSPFGRD